MSAKSVDLANAIVTTLNDSESEYVMAFEAKRRAAPFAVQELDELKTLKVSVFGGTTKSARVTRGQFAKTYKPIVAIQQKLDGLSEENELARVDQLAELGEQIEAQLEGVDLADLTFVAFDEEQDREQYSSEALRDLGVYTVAIGLEYTDG